MPKQRLIHLDYFRALAILVIIAGHTYGHWQIDANWEKNLVNLITGGTAFFVFISGFFFQTLFIKNFEYSTFLIKKSKILLIPYLVLSIPFLLLLYWEFGHIPNTYQLPDYLLNDFSLGFMRLITGATFSAFWYIPFIMGIFVLSPLFIAFSKLNPIIMLSLLLILFLGAGFIHRPDNWIIRNADLLQSLIYFSGFYA
ncbi:MAG: hypothetical protein EOM23_12420, partial [Candidatus Moranbacteria bacterium]|nr:hypothetical protein [Candidatus Moranbacteria bacterium]